MARRRNEVDPITEDAVLATITEQAEIAAAAEAARRQEAEDEALLTRWTKRLTHARQHDEQARKTYAEDRKYAAGKTDWLVDTNIIGSILEVLTAFIYAKDPDVSVRPSSSVGSSRLPQMTMVAKTIEIVLSRQLKQARLKSQAKRWLRSAMTVGVGWLKAGMATTMKPDPVMEREINSLQANLAALDVAQGVLAAGDARDEDEARAEIRAKITACQAKLERESATGAIIDFMAAEDVLTAPECGEVENYLQAPWNAFDNYKTREEAWALCDWEDTQANRDLFKSANLYVQRERTGEQGQEGTVASTRYFQAAADAEAEFGFVKVVEIWSLTDGVVYTLVEGVKKWLRQPYAPRTGARFYPHFLLAFHYVDALRHPQSDVSQLRKLQDEYGSTRSKLSEHRRRSVPGVLYDKTVLTKDSMEAITGNELSQYVGVETSNGQPIGTALFPKPYAPIDPSLYDTSVTRSDMEKVSGAQDAQQGSVTVEKTLGEAEIQNSGFMARTGARKDALEDALSELCEYLAQLNLQVTTTEDAVRLAGPEAVWVQLSVEEALTMFTIEVKAGSTGKPQKNIDKQTWATLLPLMQAMIDKIGQARVLGHEWAAKPWISLLRETAARLDDRIDVDAMLPVPPPAPPPAPPQPTPVEDADIKEAEAHAKLYMAQAAAALVGAGIDPSILLAPQAGGGPDPAALATLLAGVRGGQQPGAPSDLIPDPGAASPLTQ